MNRLNALVRFPEGVFENSEHSKENQIRILSLIILSIPVIIGSSVELPEIMNWGSVLSELSGNKIETMFIGIIGLFVSYLSHTMDKTVLAANNEKGKQLAKEKGRKQKSIDNQKRVGRSIEKNLRILEGDVENLREEEQWAKSEVKELKNEEEKMKDLKDELKISVSNLKSSSQSRKKNIQRTKKEIAETRQEKETLEVLDETLAEEEKRLTIEFNKEIREIKQLSDSVLKMQKNIKQIAEQYDTIKGEISDISEEFAELEKLDEQLQKDLEESENEVENIEQKTSDVNQRITKKESMIRDLTEMALPWRKAKEDLEEIQIMLETKKFETELRMRKQSETESLDTENTDDEPLFS